MMNTVLFDLDGTLTDPGEGITNAVRYALKKFSIDVSDRASLYKFIGPPLRTSFCEYYGFTKEQSEEAVKFYREYYNDIGLLENRVYDGIVDLLIRLRENGFKLLVATSKPEECAVRILEHFQLLNLFDHVYGATMDATRSEKKDVVRFALEDSGVNDPKCAIMVGDRMHDIIGARENGLDTIAVTFGYGSEEEFKQYDAKYIAKSPEDVLQICLRLK